MLKLGKIGPQYRIREKITELVGPEKAAAFYDRWLANDIRKIDIDSMAAWGFNSVRLPMHYALYTLPVDKEPVAGKDTWVEKGFGVDGQSAELVQGRSYLPDPRHACGSGRPGE